MARPLRLEFAGAVYHLTARGDRQEAIFLSDADRRKFLELFAKEVAQQDWICYAYCLMDNHYHLLIETPHPNLVAGMRRLNGVYTQAFNFRRKKPGHVFQGRYKSILVDKDSYVQELCRYIVLNPVRAKLVQSPEQWSWSSFLATAGLLKEPSWLATDEVLAWFSGSRTQYRNFVMEGIGKDSVWGDLKGQIYLGSGNFLERMQERAAGKSFSRDSDSPDAAGAAWNEGDKKGSDCKIRYQARRRARPPAGRGVSCGCVPDEASGELAFTAGGYRGEGLSGTSVADTD